MAHQQGEDADYMADEYDMEEGDDDMVEEFHIRDLDDSESDVEDYDYLVSHLTLWL